ncbi:hypothetical protein [Streptomyces blattellae]|uniref:hypothetical protein n=1 Tax=Streptomyces blattellae TaxID=2569855 RepID=UPI0012B99EA6|nr:hypothetical protein [Streptomyces blattellae]
MTQPPPGRGRKSRRRREGGQRSAGVPADPDVYWTPERIATAPGAAWPVRAPLRPIGPEEPHLLRVDAPDLPAKVPRAGRPTFWLMETETEDAGCDPAVVREGLLRLLAAEFGTGPGEPVVDTDRCPECSRPHGFTATSPGRPGRRVYVGFTGGPGAAVYALSDTPVGVGMANTGATETTPADPATADPSARSLARRDAWTQSRPRGCCGRRSAGGLAEPHGLVYVAVPEPLRAAVIWAERPPPG